MYDLYNTSWITSKKDEREKKKKNVEKYLYLQLKGDKIGRDICRCCKSLKRSRELAIIPNSTADGLINCN